MSLCECRYAECLNAECHYAECHYAGCRSTVSVIVRDKDCSIEQKFRFYVKCCNGYRETVGSGAAHFYVVID